ncbi:dTDP-4-dehydrorhamnose 3,5-epimerase [Pseudarcicella hirudinis]|uniref:dTDP-4-dehydrorhamnose 3,5-epimerase n=1 Tax=Pseudarcicella hirudinis TaxID=1079859 RepID=A0A1I5SQK8_9BACT|nr:dTDP-4-dehydrorhamnose 3,5-epimerase family protein [Pseudarcicella hirudinis]SFP73005.1 dTDP-4-dehydrorhamnose 3,5-epimerase [Pseudarcicella hirudinis]
MTNNASLKALLKPMNKKSILLSGSELHETNLVFLKESEDERGSFTEIFQKDWGTVLNPVQWSLVRSEQNVLRGMHLHLRHDEYFCLIEGHCLVGLKDMRPESPTYGKSVLYELHGSELSALIFPRGVIHGWYFFRQSIHIQAVSEAYHHYNDDDNLGCYWKDPELNINWPEINPILSEKARNAPSLSELLIATGISESV